MNALALMLFPFTLLDVHPESIQSVKAIVDTLGLADSVASFETQDACSYSVCSDQLPDIILLEVEDHRRAGCLEAGYYRCANDQ